MDLELIERKANEGHEWAKKKLQEIEAQSKPIQSTEPKVIIMKRNIIKESTASHISVRMSKELKAKVMKSGGSTFVRHLIEAHYKAKAEDTGDGDDNYI